jgi:cytochrome b subunit of formate dehydrogenase
MIWFFIIVIVLLALLGIALWVAYVHDTAPNNGA